ncbi:hypothetical protein NADFUDRAFT_56601 [Nadsonia fulvescens var. elongata DSM 6958]|uniref:Ribosomal lysine N-methyltransferase 5 n=1 Tax=Nadsonia fulvescens var. elongata DSM 6958 TaxID=857566 RepID=A0A1E3PRN2_9ASCO|nr:hypothetical protein NADFUDRAFT_56601 [Nadsonia fulvescens var. elongata DSM 6958]
MRSQRLARSALNSLVCQHNYSWSLNIFQNFGLLRSKEAKGTTGAVIWKVSHKMLQWLFTDFEAVQGPVKYQLAYNYKLALFAPNNSIVELGCGISGIFTSTVGSKVSTYIATDQSHIIKHSSRNILANVNKSQVYSTTIDELSDTSNASCRGKSKIEIVEYDWEQANQQIDRLKNYLPETSTTVAGRFPDWILASDTIYNSFLIPWFVDALKLVCGPHTQILIAQQLRSEEIFGEFLEALLSKGFEVWAIGMADDTVHDCSRGKDYIPSGFTDTELLENGLLGKGYSLHYLRLSQKVD